MSFGNRALARRIAGAGKSATRSLRLTPEGERFMQTCDAMTSAWTRGQNLLRQGARSVEGRMHIAAPTDTCAQFLAPWISDYIKAHPRLAVTLRVGDRMHDLPREAVDIAVRYGELNDSSMISRVLVRSTRRTPSSSSMRLSLALTAAGV